MPTKLYILTAFIICSAICFAQQKKIDTNLVISNHAAFRKKPEVNWDIDSKKTTTITVPTAKENTTTNQQTSQRNLKVEENPKTEIINGQLVHRSQVYPLTNPPKK